MTILLNWLVFPIGEVVLGRVCACSLHSRLFSINETGLCRGLVSRHRGTFLLLSLLKKQQPYIRTIINKGTHVPHDVEVSFFFENFFEDTNLTGARYVLCSPDICAFRVCAILLKGKLLTSKLWLLF